MQKFIKKYTLITLSLLLCGCAKGTSSDTQTPIQNEKEEEQETVISAPVSNPDSFADLVGTWIPFANTDFVLSIDPDGQMHRISNVDQSSAEFSVNGKTVTSLLEQSEDKLEIGIKDGDWLTFTKAEDTEDALENKEDYFVNAHKLVLGGEEYLNQRVFVDPAYNEDAAYVGTWFDYANSQRYLTITENGNITGFAEGDNTASHIGLESDACYFLIVYPDSRRSIVEYERTNSVTEAKIDKNTMYAQDGMLVLRSVEYRRA